ncbi:dehydrogenase [Brachybacterium ginsengisoli]|uniref:Dehydrogenase n=1 Tax=Brachybacterium ginsengisoli TaxID=1331682 RepID=A0A291GU15_9MICO|nr:Gfo/Idh/MocA family oxidoreductase [Brachybacterium ginsengisoli]ATG53584.1 dehydrogenase [Brachybacterium ginsengisoli]
MNTPRPRRFAFVGTGHRCEMYVRAVLGQHADAGTPVAWCDTNPIRMQYYDRLVAELSPSTPVPSSWAPDDFDAMVAATSPDVIVITTPDALHSDYIVRALAHDLDVVVEKPITTTAEKARAIAGAAQRSSGRILMTFNYRYSPRNTLVRQLVADGSIGTVTSVHFEWLLDTGHGADYFRRWHRQKEMSGGLQIHKASHHFDLVNWWLGDSPAQVTALGSRRFYGAEHAAEHGVDPSARTSRELPPSDPFRVDLAADDRLRALNLDAERADGYARDQNVFGEGVTIEDTMNVLVGYRGGAALTYSLYAYAPWEGYRVALNGTRGRIELDVCERPHRATADAEIDPSSQEEGASTTSASEVRPRRSTLRLQRQWERAVEIPIPEGRGGHGGGDAMLLEDIFVGDAPDPLGRRATWTDGLRSAAIGIAADQSFSQGCTVDVGSFSLPL